jgi:hypothetical protein
MDSSKLGPMMNERSGLCFLDFEIAQNDFPGNWTPLNWKLARLRLQRTTYATHCTESDALGYASLRFEKVREEQH